MINFKLDIVKRPDVITGLESMLVRIYTLIAGLAFVGVIFFIMGVNPFKLYFEVIRIAYFTEFGFRQTLLNFIPLLILGIGLAIPAKAQIDNIGMEGQYVVGALGGFWVAFTYPNMSSIFLIPLMFIGGFIAGAIWAIPIALFRVKGGFKGADVVVSFLLVFPAISLLIYMVGGPWKSSSGRGFPHTDPISDNAKLPLIGDSEIHITIFLAFAFIVLSNYLLFRSVNGIPRTKLGYEINVIGKNQVAAKIAGIDFLKIALITTIISGGLAGIAGVGEIAGNRIVLRESISSGYGFTAIAVAWLGGLNPIGIIFSAFLFAGLLTGNLSIGGLLGLPATTVDLLNGAILLFVLISEFFLRFKIVRRRD